MVINFQLNDIEEQRYNEFRSQHCGIIDIIFCKDGGIGVNSWVKCRGCGQKLEITDYDCW